MKQENQNHVNWKYRTARNLAFIGIPLFSIIFVVVFFATGFLYN